jgi:hypothetical protein
MFEQLANPWWAFVLLGVCVGVLSGLLGIGGGVVMVPALVVVMGFPQKWAQGMSLAVLAPMALVGAIRYWRNGDFDIDFLVMGLIACGSLMGVMVGTELASRLPAHVLRRIFAVVLIFLAIRMFIGPSGRSDTDGDNASQRTDVKSTIESGSTQ